MIIPIDSSCRGHRAAQIGDPVWDLATLFPAQESWTERDYLALNTNQLIESGQQATSAFFDDFAVAVDDVFSHPQP